MAEPDQQSRIPIVNYLVLDDDDSGGSGGSGGQGPHLVANACTNCGATYFDRRNGCAKCGGTEFAKKKLGTEGKVRGYTIVKRAAPGVKTPYVSAVIDLDGGGSVKANVVDVEPTPEKVPLGLAVRLVTYPVGTDDEGTEAIAFGFAPATTQAPTQKEAAQR